MGRAHYGVRESFGVSTVLTVCIDPLAARSGGTMLRSLLTVVVLAGCIGTGV